MPADRSGPSRRVLLASAGAAAFTRAPAIAQTAPKKLVLAHNGAPPEASAASLQWFAKAVTERSGGELEVEFFGGTLLTKEIEVINAVKSGNIAIGSPVGATATLFPEFGVFLVPYLVSSYAQAYALFNGSVGEQFDRLCQEKYGIKVLYYFDVGFRHVWNNRRAVRVPPDLRGLKIRVQPSKVFVDTINALGGVAVPMAWTEVITAATQGVIDGADLPVANMVPLRAYEVSKYFSMTYHNYGPTLLAMNLGMWQGLSATQQKLMLDVGREAQAMIRQTIESVDSLSGAKTLLEPLGMTVTEADVSAFKRVAQDKLWPMYQKQYPELWERIVSTAV